MGFKKRNRALSVTTTYEEGLQPVLKSLSGPLKIQGQESNSQIGLLQVEKPWGSGGPDDIWLFGGGESADAGRYNLFFIGHTIGVAYGNDRDDAGIAFNYRGYQAGATRYRNFVVYDGKENEVFRISGSTGRVGIGTTNPTEKLELQESLGTTLRLNFTLDADHDFDDIFGEIKFGNQNGENSSGSQATTSFVRSLHTRAGTGHSWEDGGLSFGTLSFDDVTVQERMRITHDGLVSINSNGSGAPTHRQLLVLQPDAGQTMAINVGEVVNEGGFIGSFLDDDLILCGGVDFVAGSWIDRSNNTRGSVIRLRDGNIAFYAEDPWAASAIPVKRMQINGDAGSVDLIYQPRACLIRNSTTSGTGLINVFQAATVSENITRVGFTLSSGQLTVPSGGDGTYVVHVTAYLVSNSTAQDQRLYVYKNNVSHHTVPFNVHSSVDPVERTMTILMDLAGGDIVDIRMDSSSTTTLEARAGTTWSMWKIA